MTPAVQQPCVLPTRESAAERRAASFLVTRPRRKPDTPSLLPHPFLGPSLLHPPPSPLPFTRSCHLPFLPPFLPSFHSPCLLPSLPPSLPVPFPHSLHPPCLSTLPPLSAGRQGRRRTEELELAFCLLFSLRSLSRVPTFAIFPSPSLYLSLSPTHLSPLRFNPSPYPSVPTSQRLPPGCPLHPSLPRPPSLPACVFSTIFHGSTRPCGARTRHECTHAASAEASRRRVRSLSYLSACARRGELVRAAPLSSGSTALRPPHPAATRAAATSPKSAPASLENGPGQQAGDETCAPSRSGAPTSGEGRRAGKRRWRPKQQVGPLGCWS